ncbi:MAG: geranylgeranylglycerol-phosphate geranylgeranyltransferase, partial [Microcystaceae cyanobacterium]
TASILVCMYSAACAINDYWDVEQDRINHPERPLSSGRLSLHQAWWSAVLLFACACIAAALLGLYCLILVAVSSFLLWNYSHLLDYNGILGNLLVAVSVASLIFLGGLVADRPFAMLYPTCFLFCYTLGKEIIWDVHDAQGDSSQGIVTVANLWGFQTAFSITWALMGILLGSIPVALLLLPMAHPLLFAVFSSIMLLSLGAALAHYQPQRSVRAYERLVFWERLSMLFGVLGLLGTAPPL